MPAENILIFDDPDLTQQFCGYNDRNLKVYEDLFQFSLFTRGNQFIIQSDQEETAGKFSLLLDKLKEVYLSGHEIDEPIIRTVFETQIAHSPEDDDSLLNSQIIIPQGFRKVFARTSNQADFIKKMNHFDINFGIGPAGTGKTFLAIAHALREILSKSKRKLVLTRPVVEAGESLGFLPGDLIQKLNPYLKPLYDAMENLVHGELINKLEETRVIEIAPLAYMRGRSLRDSYIILDEAQNTTKEQMKMFLTRIGENTKVVITGDSTQIDLPKKQESGLLQAARILQNIPEIKFTYFNTSDVVRNPVIKKIIQAYDSEYKEKQNLEQK